MSFGDVNYPPLPPTGGDETPTGPEYPIGIPGPGPTPPSIPSEIDQPVLAAVWQEAYIDAAANNQIFSFLADLKMRLTWLYTGRDVSFYGSDGRSYSREEVAESVAWTRLNCNIPESAWPLFSIWASTGQVNAVACSMLVRQFDDAVTDAEQLGPYEEPPPPVAEPAPPASSGGAVATNPETGGGPSAPPTGVPELVIGGDETPAGGDDPDPIAPEEQPVDVDYVPIAQRRRECLERGGEPRWDPPVDNRTPYERFFGLNQPRWTYRGCFEPRTWSEWLRDVVESEAWGFIYGILGDVLVKGKYPIDIGSGGVFEVGTNPEDPCELVVMDGAGGEAGWTIPDRTNDRCLEQRPTPIPGGSSIGWDAWCWYSSGGSQVDRQACENLAEPRNEQQTYIVGLAVASQLCTYECPK